MSEPRVICAWCGMDLGPVKADRTSHGICRACAEKMRRETEAYVAKQGRKV